MRFRFAGRKHARGRLRLEPLEPRLLLAADPRISEFMAVNDGTIADSDGDDSDWIEIHNQGDAALDLAGWFLTDTPGNLTRWAFPSATLAAGAYLTVFASDKDRAVSGAELHTNFKLDGDGEFLALVQPDGVTIVSQFAPEYPRQLGSISYGIGQDIRTTQFVTSGATGRFHVPASDVLGASWTGGDAGFSDATWTEVTTGVGYETSTVSTYPPPGNPYYYGPYGPGGTYNLYQIVNVSRDFLAAHNDAQARSIGGVSGHLVTIGSQAENDLVRSIRQQGPLGDVWIGLTDSASFGGTEAGNTSTQPLPPPVTTPGAGQRGRGFVWVTGEPYTYQNWLSGAPNDLAGVEDYVIMTLPGSWNDRPSLHDAATGFVRPYIVEYELHLAEPPESIAAESAKFRVTEVVNNGVLNTIGDAIGSVNSGDGTVANYTTPSVNRYDPQTNGAFHFSPPTAFATNTGADDNDIALRATANVVIPTAGEWTFGVASDDGFRLRVAGATFSSVAGASTLIFGDTMEHAGQRGPADSLAVVTLAAGVYPIELVMYERGGGAMVELFAAPGAKTAFDASFKLIGDTASGGLALSNLGGEIASDVEAAMHTINSSAYLRIPFTADEVEEFDQLTLRVKYDDGFVAYLNGEEIARRSAPAAMSWNSAATASHPNDQVVVFESIGVSGGLSALRTGANVLAFHGLNRTAGDGDFLLNAELEASVLLGEGERYFAIPTPGAANNNGGVVGVVENVEFSREHGFYDAAFTLELTTDTNDAEIRYTLDGSRPTVSTGVLYTGPITIAGTTTLRAAAYLPGFQQSEVLTQTYLFLEDVVRQTGAAFPATWGADAADYAMDPNVVSSPAYRDTIMSDLKTIPTLSLVLDTSDVFGPQGIYSNPVAEGSAWERPVSAELIFPDGSEEGFQINAGLRIYGGYSRNPSATPKHSFRLLFKGIYGPTKLEYPFFGDQAADVFDTIVLRANFNDSWAAGNGGSSFVVDEWSRRTQHDMGQPAGHGNFVHLYVNGLYWGLFNPTERHDSAYLATYFGGEKEQYDALHTFEVTDGNRTAWNMAMGIAGAGLASDAQYQSLQQWVDVENLIDYTIMNIYGGNWDWPHNNWDAGRKQEAGAKFRFFSWDAEGNLSDVNADRSDVNAGDSPGYFYSQLRANAEFRLLFADRVHKHFFNGGALTPAEASARFTEIAGEIDRAIVGESARWGDSRREPPFDRNGDWMNVRNSLNGSYFPQRTTNVLNQFKADGLYPNVTAPTFSQHGGTFDPGDTVALFVPGTQQYVSTTLVAAGASARAIVPTSGALENNWTQVGFNNFAGWQNGITGVGYERQTGYESLIGLDVGSAMFNARPGAYVRTEFTLSGSEDFDRLLLRMKYDDGYVVYLNGTPVHSVFAPNPAMWDSFATGGHEASASQFDEFDITAHLSALRVGTNVLAVHGMNNTLGSSDFIIVPELVGQRLVTSSTGEPIYYTTNGTDPRAVGGAVGANATLYNGPLTLTSSTQVKARSLVGGVWSALTEAEFSVDLTDLRVTELMYHPADPALGSGRLADDFEFIELMNIGDDTLDLAGARFSRGVNFAFAPGATLAAGARVVVVSNAAAFTERYGGGPPVTVAGQYVGRLDNAGERLTLVGKFDDVLLDFSYDDDWYGVTDGEGPSLVLREEGTAAETLSLAASWQPSETVDGSPGAVDNSVAPGAIVISEIVTHTVDAAGTWIELANTTSEFLDISGWFLSDVATDLDRYRIADGTVLAPGGFLLLTEASHFGLPGGVGVNTPFSLSRVAGSVYLTSGDSLGRVGGYRESVPFAGADPETSFGRFLNSHMDVQFAALTVPTPGAANSPVKVGPIVIHELMYHPLGDDDEHEFIELKNTSNQAVSLFDPANTANTWQLLDAVQFAFPTGVVIPAGGYVLVVPNNPEEFREAHNLASELAIYGPYTGKLDNGGENVALYKPGVPQQDGIVPVVLVDRVRYDDDPPWPISADGLGTALGRVGGLAYGNDVANWIASTTGGTPGADNIAFDSTPPSAPTGLTGTVVGSARIDLAWNPAADAQSGIREYHVFRGGVMIGTTTGTSITDSAVSAGNSFVYEVRAINGDGIIGPLSAPRTVTMVGLDSVKSTVENRVVVRFSEPVTAASATALANYSIDRNIVILAASLAADQRTVTLSTTSVVEGNVYTLTVANIVATSGNIVRPGAQSSFTLGESGFVVRMLDVNGGTDGQVGTTTEAVSIVNGAYAPGAYTFASDTTITAPYVNFGGPASFNIPPILAYPNGRMGSGTDAEREQFVLKATAVVTIPVGTWTLDFGSDDGGRVLLGGVTFTSKYNQDVASGASEIRFENPRGHGHTGGTFTVSGSALTTTLEFIGYEAGGGDSFDLSIAAYAQSGFGGNFVLLADGTLGWSVKTQATPVNQPPIVIEVSVRGTTWAPELVAELPLGGYTLPEGAAQLESLAWSNIDQIRIRFSEDVSIAANRLSILGANVPSYAPGGSFAAFSFDPATDVATWTLAAPIGRDQIRLVLDDAVADLGGLALDGDWVNQTSRFSGNGSAGGDFSFRFNVLPGDVNRSAAVSTADMTSNVPRQFTSVNHAAYDLLHDVNADGTINFVDWARIRNALGTVLPVGEPGTAPSPPAPSPPDVGPSAGRVRLQVAAVDRALAEAFSDEGDEGRSPTTVLRARRSRRLEKLLPWESAAGPGL